MAHNASQETGEAQVSPTLYPARFISGCNTPAEVTCANLVINCERDLPWLDVLPAREEALVIVGGGPSLADCWPDICSHEGAHILALNGAYKFLSELCFEPHYFMLLDARPENVEFIKEPCAKTKHFIAGQCAPGVFEALQGYDTTLYLTVMPDTIEITAHIDKPKRRLEGTVGTVGIKALCLAYALGYRTFHLYGYDSSYDRAEHHAFPQPLNDDRKTMEVYLDGKQYITSPSMANQAQEFTGFAKHLMAIGVEIHLHCRGLLPDMVAHNNKLGEEKPLAEREREKYEQMWGVDAYRTVAPGEGHITRAISTLGINHGDSIIDFGCGTGRAAQELKNKGYAVTGVDFAANSLDAGVDIPLRLACLWELPPSSELNAFYGICTDVMEHIPREKVMEVLGGIHKRIGKAVYFAIDTDPDNMGAIIGRKLHMSVFPAATWKAMLENLWPVVEMLPVPYEGTACFVCRTELGKKDKASAVNISARQILANIKENSKIFQEHEYLAEGKITEIPIAIVGGGPSLADSLEELRIFRGHIMALNGTHDYLINHGILPTMFCMTDARADNIHFVQNSKADVSYLLASHVNPAIVRKLKRENCVIFPWRALMNIGEPSGDALVKGGSTVATSAFSLALMLGFRTIHLFGVDSCWQGDAHHAYAQALNDNDDRNCVMANGQVFTCATWMVQQAEDFTKIYNVMKDEINLTVHGCGLINAMIEEGKNA